MIRATYLAISVLILAVQPALADDTELADSKLKGKDLGTLSFKLENDLFGGTDRHYTNGLRLSWLSPQGETVEPLEIVRTFLETIAQEHNRKDTRYGLALGQDIYTPTDRFRTDLIEDDRPYAGWLYGAMSLHTVIDGTEGRKTLESVELSLGVVGPESLGEEAQDLVHDVRLIDKFNGWDHQLRTEPGILINYERKWRLADPWKIGGPKSNFQFDAIPHAGASLGNILTHANVGGAVRLGYNLGNDFGPPSLIQGMSPPDAERRGTEFSVYLFAGAEGRYVARNIFLDGNTFRDSHSVKKKRLVGDLSLGAAVEFNRFRLAYTNAFRSKEFDGQDRISRFGSITFSVQARF